MCFPLGHLIEVEGHTKHHDGTQLQRWNAGQRRISEERVMWDDPDVSGADQMRKGDPVQGHAHLFHSNRDGVQELRKKSKWREKAEQFVQSPTHN